MHAYLFLFLIIIVRKRALIFIILCIYFNSIIRFSKKKLYMHMPEIIRSVQKIHLKIFPAIIVIDYGKNHIFYYVLIKHALVSLHMSIRVFKTLRKPKKKNNKQIPIYIAV